MATRDFEYELEEVAELIIGDAKPVRVVVIGYDVDQAGTIRYRVCWFGESQVIRGCYCLGRELRKVPKPVPVAF